jgi:hypothetical protein
MLLDGLISGLNNMIKNPGGTSVGGAHWYKKIIQLIIALIMIIALACFAYMIYYMFSVQYIRPFFINAPQNFDTTLSDAYNYFNVAYHTITESKVLDRTPFKIDRTLKFIEDNIIVQPLDVRDDVKRKYVDTLAQCPPISKIQDLCLSEAYIQKRDAGKLTALETLHPEIKETMVKDPRCAVPIEIPMEFPVRNRKETYWEIYLYHDDIFGSKLDNWIYLQLEHYRQYSVCGSENQAGYEYVKGVVQTIKDVQFELEMAMDVLKEFEKTPFDPDHATEILEVCMCVHRLYFYIVQKAQMLKDMSDSRRFSLMNFFMTTIRPFTKIILYDEVLSRIKRVFLQNQISKSWTECAAWWKGVGEGIEDMKTYIMSVLKGQGFEGGGDYETKDIPQAY